MFGHDDHDIYRVYAEDGLHEDVLRPGRGEVRAANRNRRARIGAVAFVAMAIGALVAHEVRSTLQSAPSPTVAAPAAPAPAAVPRASTASPAGGMRSNAGRSVTTATTSRPRRRVLAPVSPPDASRSSPVVASSMADVAAGGEAPDVAASASATSEFGFER